jgi:pimeloyl-ACP methyl ester carboxylesterase
MYRCAKYSCARRRMGYIVVNEVHLKLIDLTVESIAIRNCENTCRDLGEIFLDGKCMQSDRLVYNNILEIRERMRNFHYCLGHIPVFFVLFFISFSIADANLGIAQTNQDQKFPYQTPLFSSLDDREVVEASPHRDGTAMILQNATISQVSSSSSDALKVLDELATNTGNSTRTVNGTQDGNPNDPSVSSEYFMLDNVSFKHYRDDVNGITMHYVMGGDGDPIVLLHGWPQTWYEWRGLMPVLAKNNFTVIVPDLRGLGDTSKPASGYDGNTTASDIYQLVSGLGFNTAYLVGHDIGAQTAYSYATAHPGNVSKLVVIDYVFPGLFSNESFAEPWWFSFHRALDLPEALVGGNEREYLSWFYRQLAYNPYSIDEAAIDEYVRQYSTPGGMRSGFEYFRASSIDAIMNNETSRSNLTLPILAVSGEVSPFGGGDTKPNYSLDSARRLANNVSAIIMPSSGHWIPEEQPGPLAGLLIEFFNEKSQLPSSNETGTKTANAIENLIKSIDNDSLLEPNISLTNNLSTAESPDQTSSVPADKLSTGPVQGPGSDETLRNTSRSGNMSGEQSTNFTTTEKQDGEQLAERVTVPGNGSSIESARSTDGQIPQNQSEDNIVGEEPLAEQGTPLSEAIEAISKLFGRNNGD